MRCHSEESEIKYAATAIVALALSASFAFAHKHKGWGCHMHKGGDGLHESNMSTWRTHCGNGSR